MDLAVSRWRAGLRFSLFALVCAAGGAQDCASLLGAARKDYEAREFDRAVAGFERARERCPNRGQVLLALGQAQLMAQRLDASASTFRELIRLDPSHAAARKLLADALYLARKEQEAVETLEAALAVDPKNTASRYALGRILYQQNRYPEAVEQLKKVVEIDPDHYRAYDNLGLCYDALQRDADAVSHFFKALDLVQRDHPDYDWAHANLADFFLKRNEFEKAFQLAAEAAQRNPNSARNFFLTGKALVKLNKEDVSLRWLERAIQLDPRHRESLYLLSQTYRRLGRNADADRVLDSFRALGPSGPRR
ncbi:MAG: tetratricopeptide repeat protein [Bryobacteraceae bacterium]